MTRLLIFLSLALGVQATGMSQSKPKSEPNESEKPVFVPTRYFVTSYGSGNAGFRDFATSPLFYRGSMMSLQMAWHKKRLQSMREWSLETSFSATSAQLPEEQTYEPISSAVFSSSSLSYTYMQHLPKLDKGKFTFAAGGIWLNTFNFRMNQSLGNNAVGLEFFSNIMAAGSVHYDASHAKSGRRYYLKNLYYTRHPRNQRLSFQFNAGLLNWNYRPGYAYKELPELDGSKTNPFALVLSGFDWKLNGYRFGSEFSFTRFKQNGNAVKWSYSWDILHAPGRFDSFQMAMHRIRFSLLFNRN
jgi:hypothetical protein